MEKHVFKTSGVCSQEIHFEKDGDVIHNIEFVGGCSGNLRAIAKLCEGLTAQDIASKLKGNICGSKNTSCADQLARALIES